MAASLNGPKHYRVWESKDSFEQSDVVRLFDPENVKSTKSVKCTKYFTVYSTLIGFFVLFLLGIFVGFFLRADPKVTNDCSATYQRKDGFDKEKLQAVHNNIVYYMSGDKISEYNSELSALERSSTSGDIDRLSAEYVAREFRKFGLDQVDIEQHDVVVTSPDPNHPNRLEILSPDGTSNRNFTLSKGDKSSHVTASGMVKGQVVFGNYGRQSDFFKIRKSEINLDGSIVLLKIGWNSVLNKVRLASRFGCSAVLLFCGKDDSCCHGNQCGDDEVPDLDSTELSDVPTNDFPTIPVQAVSHRIAEELLVTMNQSKHNNSLDITNNTLAENPLVLLEVYTKHVVRTIHNVVATIYGEQESDRMVIIGAERSSDGFMSGESPNSGILLELARSMGYIRQREHWKPQRTVRFVSLADTPSYTGLQQYFQSKKHILQQEGVAFIDLDLQHYRSKVTEFKSDITLLNLITQAYNMVPDPSNPEISLAESWPNYLGDAVVANQKSANIFSNNEYVSSHRVGVPTISIQSLPNGNNKLNNFLISREANHADEYNLALGRVVSHAALKLLDDQILPFNISLYTQHMMQSLNYTLNRIEHQYPGLYDYDGVLSQAHQLSTLASRLQSMHDRTDCSNIRSVNDVLMRFENIFHIERSGEDNLYLDGWNGSLFSILNDPDTYVLSQNKDTVKLFIETTLSILQESHQELDSVMNR